MATSGNTSFTVTTEDIIQEAYELIGVVPEGGTYNPDQYVSALRTLNMLIKSWEAEGLNIFAVENRFLFMEKGSSTYDLNDPSTRQTNNLKVFQTANDALMGATTLDADLPGPIDAVVGDIIGVRRTDGTVFWTTLAATPTTPTVTLVDALPEAVQAATGVFYWPVSPVSPVDDPNSIMDAFLCQSTQVSEKKYRASTDTKLTQIGSREYYNLSTKQNQGTPSQFYVEKRNPFSKTISVYPTPSKDDMYLHLIVTRSIQGFTDIPDNPDYPKEWYMPLALNLAKAIGLKYGIPREDYQRIWQEAAILYERARGYDQEFGTSVFFGPGEN